MVHVSRLPRPLPTPRLPRAGVAMFVAVAAAQAADALTFVRMVQDHGIRAEGNPIVAHLLEQGSVVPLLIVKLMLIVLVVGVFELLVRRYPIAGSLIGTVAVVAGLIGAWSNVHVIAGPMVSLLP
jgi:hypothetical protein